MRIRAAVGLLTGHTTLRAHMYKVGLAQSCKTANCRDDKEGSVHMYVCKIQNLGSMLLRPKDLQKVRVGGLLSLVANTRLGFFP